jgi:hypothetical protein
VGLLTGAIVVPVAPLVDRETILFVLFVVAICFCCFGGAATLAAVVVVGFVAVGGVVDDDIADVGGGGVADNEGGFSVFGIPHTRASVVLTTFRLGLLGSHIFALSSSDIGLLRELPVGDDDVDNVGEDDC